jgi:glycosyltransferase involved in cell wall biosynthesis
MFTMSDAQPVMLSVVVPVYGCFDCLNELVSQLEMTLPTITNFYEIILIDDRSPDDSWSKICDLQSKHSRIKGIRLSRNYGQHIAITAGLAAAKGAYTVVMDCDLQDPPSLIPELFSKIQEGYDFALAKRVERTHSQFRQRAAKLYFSFLNRLSGASFDRGYGSFSILSRKVVDAFLMFQERERHYLFILHWLGFKYGTVEYSHRARHAGRSSYSFVKLLQHALDGILFQTTALLRWIAVVGVACALAGLAIALFIAWRAIFHTALPGWTSLAVLILVCTGIIMTSLGVLGMYISKIFEQSKGRPLYVLDTVLESVLPTQVEHVATPTSTVFQNKGQPPNQDV